MPDPVFAVVNMRDGQRRDVASFLLDNDAFPVLENAYLFRGKLQRKSCYSPVGLGEGRLRYQIGTTDGTGAFSITLPNAPLGNAFSEFSVGNEFLIDPTGGSPATLASSGSATGTLDTATGALSIASAALNTAVFYYPGLPVMGLSTREADEVNVERLIAFDTKFSYLLDTGTENFIGANTYKTTNAIFTWEGDDSDFFYTTNYLGSLFTSNNVSGLNAYTITNSSGSTGLTIILGTGTHSIQQDDKVLILNTNNGLLNGLSFNVTGVTATTITINNTTSGSGINSGFVVALDREASATAGTTVTNGDPIRYYDGPGSGTGWVNFVAPLNSGTPQRVLRGGLIILPYKERLLILNTVESEGDGLPIRYRQRARWCQIGTPYFTEDDATPPNEYLIPANQNANFDAWFDQVTGKGGFIDAPTNQAIVAAEYIKDTLIVYFERSTWQLVYAGNIFFPFYWQQINTELGVESTFSTVPFDRGVFGVGPYGIITTDSVNVQRIDEKIPDEVFRIQNKNNGSIRTHGIRDYDAQLVYWCYPALGDLDDDEIVNNANLKFPNQVLVYNYLDGSWAQNDDVFTCFGYYQQVSDKKWEDLNSVSWQEYSASWNSGVNIARYPDVIAGNPRGYVFVISQRQNLNFNSPSYSVSRMTGPTLDDQITITVPNHNLGANEFVYLTNMTGLTNASNVIYKILSTTETTITLDASNLEITGTYTAGGRVTQVPKIYVRTKEFNPFYEEGKGVRMNYVDFYMNRSTFGEFTIESFVSDNNSDVIASFPVPTNAQNLFEQGQRKIFQRVHFDEFGNFVQFVFTLTDDQMKNKNIVSSDFVMHGMVMYLAPAGRLAYDF